MIAHRATLLTKNSAILLEELGSGDLPKGERCCWNHRGRLCVSKHHADVAEASSVDALSSGILANGTIPHREEFIEVHVFGPISILTVEKILIRAQQEDANLYQDMLVKKIRKLGLETRIELVKIDP